MHILFVAAARFPMPHFEVRLYLPPQSIIVSGNQRMAGYEYLPVSQSMIFWSPGIFFQIRAVLYADDVRIGFDDRQIRVAVLRARCKC